MQTLWQKSLQVSTVIKLQGGEGLTAYQGPVASRGPGDGAGAGVSRPDDTGALVPLLAAGGGGIGPPLVEGGLAMGGGGAIAASIHRQLVGAQISIDEAGVIAGGSWREVVVVASVEVTQPAGQLDDAELWCGGGG